MLTTLLRTLEKSIVKNKIQYIFLELLRAGLWRKMPSLTSSLSSEEWEKVMMLAMQHAVVGVVMDGINFLSDDQKPSKNIIMKWLPYLVQIERNNKRLDDATITVWNRLNNEGIKTVLLKGQGVAREYPMPEHRQPGDIDLYVCHGKMAEVRRITKKWNINNVGENIKHYFFSMDDIEVELHRMPIYSHLLPASRRLKHWMIQKLNSSNRKWGDVTIPDEEFNMVFEFNHLFEHFMGEGLGLRQICDWAVCLNNAHGKYDIVELQRNLCRFNQLHSWKVFGYIAVNFLGLPEVKMPCYDSTCKAKADKVMAIVMRNGNFGNFAGKRKRPSNYVGSKLYSLTDNIYHTMEIFPIFPTDAIRNLKNPIDAAYRIYLEMRIAFYTKSCQ